MRCNRRFTNIETGLVVTMNEEIEMRWAVLVTVQLEVVPR